MRVIVERDVTRCDDDFLGLGVPGGGNGMVESNEEQALARRGPLQGFDEPSELLVSVQCARVPGNDAGEDEGLDYFCDDEDDEDDDLDDDEDLEDDFDDDDDDEEEVFDGGDDD